MLSSPKYVSRGSLGMRLTPVAPATVYKTTRFKFKIEYNDEVYNLPNHYVDIYINGQYFITTQEPYVDLESFRSLIQPGNPFIMITIKTKRIINGYSHYSDTETTMKTYDFFVGEDIFCGEEQVVRG